MKKIATIFLAGSVFASAFAGSAAHAQTAPPAQASGGDDCTPSAADFAALQAIQTNPDLTPAQELGQELALRKQLLGETLACAISDAQALQQSLNGTAMTGAAATVQSQVSDKLDDAVNFYNTESGKLADAGISGTEAVARDVLAWRAANYAPLEGEANNLILWSENQPLFETAQNRLTQTGRVVDLIETASQNNELQASYSAAQASLEQAGNGNAAAFAALQQFQAPNQSLTLIRQSLQTLAGTYQKFSDLNGLIQTLLPAAGQ
ncbi:MAG TPA: hypothetical protein VMT81_02180 [Candidatus Paceibacterota bacterium]|nr:hypothetical protein [Candidatus Paceibacterota bacterium]